MKTVTREASTHNATSKTVIYIRFNWISHDKKLVSKAQELAELYRNEKQPKRRNRRPFEDAFNVILTSLEVLGGYSHWGIRIPTDHNLYYKTTQRDATYTSEVLDSLKWLVASDYLQKVDGMRVIARTVKMLPFAYAITDKWSSRISPSPLSEPSLIRRNPLASYIQLRNKFDDVTRVVPWPDPVAPDVQSMADETTATLRCYDEMMRGVTITLGGQDLNSGQTSLTRIFSRGSFTQGGRLYAPIQNLKSKVRPYLYFNGEPTVEFDFSSIHPNFLYQIEGLEFDGKDPYSLAGFERGEIKKAFNIMLNRSPSEAGSSAWKALVDHLSITKDQAENIEEAIKKLHYPIAHHFNTGKGLELQRRDSDVALSVIDYFVRKKRPIIPIHDSFIVSVRDTEDLTIIMTECYRAVMNEDYWSEDIHTMRGGKCVYNTEYSEDLQDAILKAIRQNTDDMGTNYWNRLISNEPIHHLQMEESIVDEDLEEP